MPDDVTSVVVMFYPIFALQFYLEMMYLRWARIAVILAFWSCLG